MAAHRRVPCLGGCGAEVEQVEVSVGSWSPKLCEGCQSAEHVLVLVVDTFARAEDGGPRWRVFRAGQIVKCLGTRLIRAGGYNGPCQRVLYGRDDIPKGWFVRLRLWVPVPRRPLVAPREICLACGAQFEKQTISPAEVARCA